MDQTQQLLQSIPKIHALCFTGHRPEGLPTGNMLTSLIGALHYYIDYAVGLGYTHFLTGMADGIDYYAAEYLFRRQQTWPGITVIGVQPCADFGDLFRGRSMNAARLAYLRRNVDILIEMPGSFRTDRSVFRRRNFYMVDHASAIIAVCDENSRSGSMQTLRYARKNHLSGVRLVPQPERPLPLLPENWPAEHFGL